MRDLLCENISVNDAGHLTFAGADTVELVKEFGTPLYIYDKGRICERMTTYLSAVKEAFGNKGKVLYASKAASFKEIYRICKEQGMGVDVVSSGEICTALAAGYPLSKAYFHSNNKTDEDISYAIDNGIGYFVVDNAEELYSIDSKAKEKGIIQPILLRLTPDIDPHTFEAVSTGKVDSKFGSAIATGQADEMVQLTISFENLQLAGFHCHIGSQVFDSEVFLKAAKVMLEFIAYVRDEYGIIIEQLDLGGGYGVRYKPEDPHIDIAENILSVGRYIKEKCEALKIEMPTIGFEPGRSIVADAGMTLYTVGTLKKIPEFINYVSVDGGMTDNIRYALYGADYTLVQADNMNAECDMECSVVGRCCESGDVLQTNVLLPSTIKRGNILACLTTGAYNYSMASNYNRIPRPPIVMIENGRGYVAVRRETKEDLINLDI